MEDTNSKYRVTNIKSNNENYYVIEVYTNEFGWVFQLNNSDLQYNKYDTKEQALKDIKLKKGGN